MFQVVVPGVVGLDLTNVRRRRLIQLLMFDFSALGLSHSSSGTKQKSEQSY